MKVIFEKVFNEALSIPAMKAITSLQKLMPNDEFTDLKGAVGCHFNKYDDAEPDAKEMLFNVILQVKISEDNSETVCERLKEYFDDHFFNWLILHLVGDERSQGWLKENVIEHKQFVEMKNSSEEELKDILGELNLYFSKN